MSDDEIITMDQYAAIEDDDTMHDELIGGRVVRTPLPRPYHGYILANVAFEFSRLRSKKLKLSLNFGFATRSNPDTVRRIDVGVFLRSSFPNGEFEDSYIMPAPRVVFLMLFPWFHRSDVCGKAAELIDAGVGRVCLLNTDDETVTVIDPRGETVFTTVDSIAFPDLLPRFSLSVSKIFE